MSYLNGIGGAFSKLAQLTPEKFRVFQVMNAAIRAYGMDNLSLFSIWYDEQADRGVHVRLYSSHENTSRRLLCWFVFLNEAIDRSPNANDLARNLSMIIGAYSDAAPKKERKDYPTSL